MLSEGTPRMTPTTAPPYRFEEERLAVFEPGAYGSQQLRRHLARALSSRLADTGEWAIDADSSHITRRGMPWNEVAIRSASFLVDPLDEDTVQSTIKYEPPVDKNSKEKSRGRFCRRKLRYYDGSLYDLVGYFRSYRIHAPASIVQMYQTRIPMLTFVNEEMRTLLGDSFYHAFMGAIDDMIDCTDMLVDNFTVGYAVRRIMCD